MTIKAIFIDDHPMLLRGLTLLFETIDDVEIVATTTDGSQALSLARMRDADVVVTDAAMPTVDGLAVVQQCAPYFPTIVLTTFDDANLVASLIDAGASGYILKDVRPEELTSAIIAVADGGLVLDPRIARYVHGVKELALLTETEKKVARLVAEGKSNAEIAAELYLAEGTVKNHVSSLRRKLHARDRTVLALSLAKSFGL